MPIIFLRIAWMKEYKGVTEVDIPKGGGSHIEEYGDGGEVYNFYPVNGNYYGYVRVQSEKNIRLERLGATMSAPFKKEMTIVFFATDPCLNSQIIVGWYKDAIIYREKQKLERGQNNHYSSYHAESKIKNSFLIEEDHRKFQIPKKGPGQSNVWYIEEYSDKDYLVEVEKYIANPKKYIFRNSKRKSNGNPWQKDIALRQQVEHKAMETVANHFEERGYRISYVQNENLGWDIRANLGAQTLLLEVKGLSMDFSVIEFTHNEYTNSKNNSKNYRICIVSNALNAKKRKLDIYYNDKGKWVTIDNKLLKIKELITARFYK